MKITLHTRTAGVGESWNNCGRTDTYMDNPGGDKAEMSSSSPSGPYLFGDQSFNKVK